MDRDSDPLQSAATHPPDANFPGSGTELVGLHAGDASQREIFGMPVLAELPSVELQNRTAVAHAPRRRWLRAIGLFVATCTSMWFAACPKFTVLPSGQLQPIPHYLLQWEGPLFLLAMMSTLFAHEMGHFLQSLRYRIPASLPYFIPFPLSPIGTMGADRRCGPG